MNLFCPHESWTSELLSRYVRVHVYQNHQTRTKPKKIANPVYQLSMVIWYPCLVWTPHSPITRHQLDAALIARETLDMEHIDRSCSGDGVVCQGGPRRGHRPSSHTRWLKYWRHRPNMRPPGRIICEQRKGKINDVTLKYNNRKYNSRIARCHSRVSQSILIVIKSTTKELRIMCRYNYFSINGRWNLLTQKS